MFKKQAEKIASGGFDFFNKKLIILVLFLIIFLLIFFSLYFSNKDDGKKIIPPEDIPPAQELPKINVPVALYNLFGTVKSIQSEKIIFEAKIPQFDENNRDVSRNEIREIIITPLTEFKSLVFVTDKATGLTLPTELKAVLEDIKIGNYIEVISSKNIKDLKIFEAKRITIINQ